MKLSSSLIPGYQLTSNVARDLARLNIAFPTALPILKITPSRAKQNQWLERQRYSNHPKIYEVARQLIANLNHISFSEFNAQLRKTVSAFHDACQEPYVIIFTQTLEGRTKNGCSEQWVIGLALEHHHLRCPEAIVTSYNLGNYLKENPNIKHFLILDDAAYSGTHLRHQIEVNAKYFLPKETHALKLYIGVPFISRSAKEAISKSYLIKSDRCDKGTYNDITPPFFLSHKNIPSVHELLSTDMAFVPDGLFSPGVTLTTFDHKLPDYMSTSRVISHGLDLLDTTSCLLLREGITTKKNQVSTSSRVRQVTNKEFDLAYLKHETSREALIPPIVSPYKMDSLAEIHKLRQLLEQLPCECSIQGNWIPKRYIHANNVNRPLLYQLMNDRYIRYSLNLQLKGRRLFEAACRHALTVCDNEGLTKMTGQVQKLL